MQRHSLHAKSLWMILEIMIMKSIIGDNVRNHFYQVHFRRVYLSRITLQ